MKARCMLVLLAMAAVHLLPEHLAALGLGTQAALEYIAYGLEASALWLAWLVVARGPMRYIAAWGLSESMARAAGRAAFPLDRPPPIHPGQTLLDAAVGWPAGMASLVVALLLVAYINHRGAGR